MEIERKFLLSAVPAIEPEMYATVKQIYLCINPETRIRVIEDYKIPEDHLLKEPEATITVKGDGGLVREELISGIDKTFAYETITLLGRPPIIKHWQAWHYGDLLIETNIVDRGTPNEFIYAEVEFPDIESAQKFVWPYGHLIADVTEVPKYKMKNYWKRTRI